jgi:hypothetical protein
MTVDVSSATTSRSIVFQQIGEKAGRSFSVFTASAQNLDEWNCQSAEKSLSQSLPSH